MTTIADVPAPTTIVFGTDGWRARVADDFTFENVRRCADGVARYVVERGEQAKGVVIAFDRRFASEHFAAAAAEVLLAHDIPVFLAASAVPTQMSSYEVVERGAAAGIVITASHNPWTDNGFKVKSPTGAAAGPEILAVLEATIATNGRVAIERRPLADAEAAGLVERFDPFEGYERYVRRTIDLDALKAADISILVEPLYGAGSSWIPRLLRDGRIRVTEIHNERNPYFGGINPEPIRPNVDAALAIIAGGGYDLGLFLDGDADRAGAADERGEFIHQLQVTGLVMYHLAEHRGLREPVVVSVNNTSMVARLGERYGIATHETPVGFKYIGELILAGKLAMGGEESAGMSMYKHLPEKDGILACLLVAEMVARTGKKINQLIEEMYEEFGYYYSKRADMKLTPALKDSLASKLANPPKQLDGMDVKSVNTTDGVKLIFNEQTWLLFRLSGTEPVARIYAEACSPKKCTASSASTTRNGPT